MPQPNEFQRRHFFLSGYAATEAYGYKGGGGGSSGIPPQNRQSHAQDLRNELAVVEQEMQSAIVAQSATGVEYEHGIILEFEAFPELERAFDDLSFGKTGIELRTTRQVGSVTKASVFVPYGKLDHLEKWIIDYLAEKKKRNGNAADNQKIIDTIRHIRTATVKALWTDGESAFPASDVEVFWWEVWLSTHRGASAVVGAFRSLMQQQGIQISPTELSFIDRVVVQARCSSEQLANGLPILNMIAELKRAKVTAEYFTRIPVDEQQMFVDDLLQHLTDAGESDQSPRVAILDTGLNRGHGLLIGSVTTRDLHTVDQAWGVGDDEGHGTAMAGLALFGDLTPVLENGLPVLLEHRLESVKLLPENGRNVGDGLFHAALTTQAVALPEIMAPQRKRVFSLAITADDQRDLGRPSAWSASVDALCTDSMNSPQQRTRRLFMVSAGNINDLNEWSRYPESNKDHSVQDPAQSWNALTVGAYTEKARISEPDTGAYSPVAQSGSLSPFSTTSRTWEDWLPYKPEVVFEGGNAGGDGFGPPIQLDSLSLLTTSSRPFERPFIWSNATSAATALAARMAAQIMAVYPELWPETVRGLIVHSAQWTPAMLRDFLPNSPSKSDYQKLLRTCGFGVPSLNRALWSLSNSLVLVSENSIQPFKRDGSAQPKYGEMNFHQIPWPTAELESLGGAQVEMRVTLSYYIEPNPSNRGRSRYRYESHGLRFEVKRPHETDLDFRRRINKLTEVDETNDNTTGGSDQDWVIGSKGRSRGSVHSDLWKGTAANLASRDAIVVLPRTGWWKSRPNLEKYESEARYSLVVSLEVPSIDIDLYSAVAQKIATPIEIEGT